MRNCVETCKGICSYNLVYNFLLQLFPLKILVFVAHFLSAFWQGKVTFPKSSSYSEITPFLIFLHLLYSKYKGVKICFYSCRYKIKIFRSCRTRVVCVALVSHSCCQCSTHVALALHSCCSCLIGVAFVSLVSGTRVVNQNRSSKAAKYRSSHFKKKS